MNKPIRQKNEKESHEKEELSRRFVNECIGWLACIDDALNAKAK